jgi:hypothetical protein
MILFYPSLRYHHLDEGIFCRVWRLAWCNDPECYAGGSVGPPLPDRSKESTQRERDTLVLQAGCWVDGPTSYHPKKNTHAKKPRRRLGSMVRPCSENGRGKITPNITEVDGETKESTTMTEEKLDGRYKEGHERKKP